jgi:hypothetical protein
LELSRELRETEITAWCLAGLAGAAVLAEDPDCAAWLWGAADALRQSIEVREAPASHSTHARLQTEARQQLGDARFKTCWREGQSASIDQAIAKAQFLSDRMGNS